MDKWLTDESVINNSKRPYAHFDYRTDFSKSGAYVCNPEAVAKHGFYPFIHYCQNYIKYNKSGERKIKSRDICYSAHIDRCIYQYYNHLLNERYNSRVQVDGLNNVAVAYRSNLGKSNIQFAHEVFQFIRSRGSCYIMIGDFTHFFDYLDHAYLKTQICSLLDVPQLPPDYYSVFKSLTRYSYWERSDLLTLKQLSNTPHGVISLNQFQRVLTPDEFHKHRGQYLKHNLNCFGIPQGSPISALLANVYMLACDKSINEYVSNLGGLYMRYSDDFTIVLPTSCVPDIPSAFSYLQEIIGSIPHLVLQPDKTQYFYYENKNIENCGSRFSEQADCKHRYINFLGFTFDGKTVSLRDKTVSKYYFRMRKKAKTIVRQDHHTKNGRRIPNHNIYRLYSRKGAKEKPGNFLTYVKRCEDEFGKDEAINRSTKRHMQKIHSLLSEK